MAEALKERFKWDGSNLIACPVLSIRDGKIVSGRWTVLGKLGKILKFKAEDLFPVANKDLSINLEVEDFTLTSTTRAATSAIGSSPRT